MSAVAIIPARGGSKGIPLKNLMLVKNKALVVYSIEHACNTPTIDRVFVSTDDGNISLIARKSGAEIIDRPAEISGDNASTESAMLHALDYLEEKEGYIPDLVVLLQPTSPVRRSYDTSKMIDDLMYNEYDSIFSASRVEGLIWGESSFGIRSLGHCPNARPRRQDKQVIYYEENGSIYVTKLSILRQDKSRLGGKIGMYVMPRVCAFELDTFDDLPEIEAGLGCFQI